MRLREDVSDLFFLIPTSAFGLTPVVLAFCQLDFSCNGFSSGVV